MRRKTKFEIDGNVLDSLLDGSCMLDGDDPFENDDAARKTAWRKSRKFILSLVGKPIDPDHRTFTLNKRRGVYFKPGTRPHAWWLYEAPEPRKTISGDPPGAYPEKGLWFGIPRFYRDTEAFENMIFESQVEYIERVDLWLPGEKAMLKR